MSNPCLNGGQCTQSQSPNDYICQCPGNFIGKNCQIEKRFEKKNNACEMYGCQNNASCKVSYLTIFESIISYSLFKEY